MNKEYDGERAVRVALDSLGIKYQPEKKIIFLKGDYKGSRRADFFLPKYNIYVEYLGGWDKKDPEERNQERQRYHEKKNAYELNNINCIWIFPNQLNYVTNVIKKKLDSLMPVELLPLYKNPLIISIFTAAILLLLSPLSYKIFLTLFSINLIFIIVFIKTKCLNCKRVFVKMHVSRDFEKMERRPWEYRIETRWLYSDGSHKNSTYSEWKKRIERVKVYKNIKECKQCSYRWVERDEENIDSSTRPQTVYKRRTHYKNPPR